METVDLVTAVINGDRDSAVAAFNAMMAGKVSDSLELKKVELATNLFTPEEEVVDEPTESETEVDGTATESDESSAESTETSAE
jgi:hypothetical protein